MDERAERAGRVLGALSRSRLPEISSRFKDELERRKPLDSATARTEVAALCRGMRFTQLSVRI